MARAAPDLNVPASTSTVNVSIINTTATIQGVNTWKFMGPVVKGHEYLAVPCYSFLIEHPALKRSLVFDLGIRKDWWNFSPALIKRFQDFHYKVTVEKSVREILDAQGVDTAALEAIVWSHWHFDHTGNPAEFEPSTSLIVGPGFKSAMLPGYPTNPKSTLLEADFAGRELREVSFEGSAVRIGRFPALDYFGDGSFYLLDAPGHAIGHLCGFARVTSNPDSFVFMGGDAAHHGGEFRPSAFMPLPDSIVPHPFTDSPSVPLCPGAMFDPLLRDGDRSQSFYLPVRPEVSVMHHDVDEAVRTIGKMQEADVANNVLVAIAHDEFLLDVVDFFPKKANDFVAKGWAKQSRWKFLKDFAGAAGWADKVAAKREWTNETERAS